MGTYSGQVCIEQHVKRYVMASREEEVVEDMAWMRREGEEGDWHTRAGGGGQLEVDACAVYGKNWEIVKGSVSDSDSMVVLDPWIHIQI